MQLAAIEYLNISGLVIDFATSPVRTGNSFFAYRGSGLSQEYGLVPVLHFPLVA